MRIREAMAEELATLQEIERAAGQCFRGIGMYEIADDDPPLLAELVRYRRAGRAYGSHGSSAGRCERKPAACAAMPLRNRARSAAPAFARHARHVLVTHCPATTTPCFRATADSCFAGRKTQFCDLPLRRPGQARKACPPAETTPFYGECLRHRRGSLEWPIVAL